MKPLKKKQLGPWCSYCHGKIRATHRADGWTGKFCCEQHKQELAKDEKRNDHISEADYETWMRV